MTRRKLASLRVRVLVGVGLRSAMKATAVSLIPAYVSIVGVRGFESFRMVFLGVPTLFVVGVTAWEVGREWGWPSVPPPSVLNQNTPGVLSQAEAVGRLNDLIFNLWEQEQ